MKGTRRFRRKTGDLPASVASCGRGTYGLPRVVRHKGDTGVVHIGNYCSIADDVEIFVGGNHRPDWVSTYPFRVRLGLPGAYSDGHPSSRGDVEVGNDVWIGAGACILSGVKIGDGAVIGARAMVARDVRPYAIVVGNPAYEVRRRFSDEQVSRLLELRWWDWPDDKIKQAVPSLCSPEIDGFLRACEPSGRGGPLTPADRDDRGE